jgi:hypothetical protein
VLFLILAVVNQGCGCPGHLGRHRHHDLAIVTGIIVFNLTGGRCAC